MLEDFVLLFSPPPSPFVSIFSVFILQLRGGKMSISSSKSYVEPPYWTCGLHFPYSLLGLAYPSYQHTMPLGSKQGSFSLTLLFRPAAFCSETYNRYEEKIFFQGRQHLPPLLVLMVWAAQRGREEFTFRHDAAQQVPRYQCCQAGDQSWALIGRRAKCFLL